MENNLNSLQEHDHLRHVVQNNPQGTADANCDLLLMYEGNNLLTESTATSTEKASTEIENSSPYKIPEIRSMFDSLLKDVWSGEWSTLRPVPFKDTLEIFYPQFRGAHQQDCQVIGIFQL